MPKGKFGGGRRRVFPINARHQLALFPEASRPTGQKFADNLHANGLISERHGKKEVKKIVATAFAGIEKLQGIDVNALTRVLRESEQLNAKFVHDKAVAPMPRMPKEQRKIWRAIETIVMAVNWKRNANALRKMHAPSTAARVEKTQQQGHLKSIQQQ